MIVKIKGKLDGVVANSAHIEINGFTYAVMVTKAVADRLVATGKVGSEISLFTINYIEGTVGMGNLIPRLVGFLNETDLEFFSMLTSVQGLSVKRSLKALTVPVKDMARAIEMNDLTALKKLPEIGGKTAQKIILELKGKAAKFALLREDDVPYETMTTGPEEEYQRDAVEILVQLQYNREEAETIVARMAKSLPDITSSEDLIQEIFKTQMNVK